MKSTYSILCIDDDPSILDIVTQNLQEYDLFAITNPLEGFKILSDNSIDLILLDIQMPKLDGFNVCQMIKDESTFKDIPIIFITASTHDEDISKAFSLGGVDYIKKPINTVELKQRVKNHLQLRSYHNELQKNVQNEIEKNLKIEQILMYRSDLLNAVKLYLSKHANQHMSKTDFQKIIHDSIKLIKLDNPHSIMKLCDDYVWDRGSSTLYCKNEIVLLRKSESLLLELLILNQNQKISLEQIHIYLWGDTSLTFNETSVRNLISSLRKKLPKNFITSVYGGKYMFNQLPSNITNVLQSSHKKY